MKVFKSNLKKYFVLLVLSYIIVHASIDILIYVFPDLLTFKISKDVTRTYSSSILIFPFTLLTNLIFVVTMRNDLKKHEIKSKALLLLTFLSSILGITFYLILISAKDLYANKYRNDTDS